MATDKKVSEIRPGVTDQHGRTGGGGGEGGGMEARVAKVEAVTEAIDKRLSLIETDIRAISKKLDTHFYITWGGIIALALLIARAMGWI